MMVTGSVPDMIVTHIASSTTVGNALATFRALNRYSEVNFLMLVCTLSVLSQCLYNTRSYKTEVTTKVSSGALVFLDLSHVKHY